MQVSRENFKKYTQMGIAAATALIVSPIIFMVIKGMIGLLIAAGIGALTLALLPAISEMLTAVKFKALKGVISRAPVEALYQRAKERWEALTEQHQILKQQASALEQFKKKTTKFVQQYPEEAETYTTQLANYEKLFAYRVDQYKQAKKANDEFSKVVEKAEAIYEMAQADAELGKSFNKDKDFMAIYREKTAFDAIDKASSDALANLRMALIDDDFVSKQVEQQEATKQVAYDPQGNVVLGNILNEVPAPAYVNR